MYSNRPSRETTANQSVIGGMQNLVIRSMESLQNAWHITLENNPAFSNYFAAETELDNSICKNKYTFFFKEKKRGSISPTECE